MKLHMMILFQGDLEAGVEFYKKLGLTCGVHVPKQWAEFMLGSVKIALCPIEGELHERHTGLVFEVADCAKFYAELLEKGVVGAQAPVTAAHGVMASIKDPSGNILDIYQPVAVPLKAETEAACCQAPGGCC